MSDPRPILAIHRLAHEGLAARKIAKTRGLSRHTTSQYLDDPHPQRPLRPRPSQRDPCKDASTRLVEIDPKVSAVGRRQRLAEQGFPGGITMVRPSLPRVRPASTPQRAFLRCASAPGLPGQLDWGHGGALA